MVVLLCNHFFIVVGTPLIINDLLLVPSEHGHGHEIKKCELCTILGIVG